MLAAGLLAATSLALAEVHQETIIDERFHTELEQTKGVNTLAAWHGEHDQHWLLATVQGEHRIQVLDANSGAMARWVGEPGQAAGHFQRPGGISVVDDLLWVVDRDNRRVTVMRLPDFDVIGTFGDATLAGPTSLWVQALGDSRYQVYVNDPGQLDNANRQGEEGRVSRIYPWQVIVTVGGLEADAGTAFGEAEGLGILTAAGAIQGDPSHDRLLLAARTDSANFAVKVYDLGGSFTGQLVGVGLFKGQVNGIALYDCPDGSGYWVMSDFVDSSTRSHVFERASLAHVGSFSSGNTAHAQYLLLAKHSFPGFPAGALYIGNEGGNKGGNKGGNVSAFSWSEVIDALDLQPQCPPPTAELKDVEQLLQQQPDSQ